MTQTLTANSSNLSSRNILPESRERPAQSFNSLIKSFFISTPPPPSAPFSIGYSTQELSSNAAAARDTTTTSNRPNLPNRLNRPCLTGIRTRRRVSQRWDTPPILESDEEDDCDLDSPESESSDECPSSDDSSEALDTVYYAATATTTTTRTKLVRPKLSKTPKSFLPVIAKALTGASVIPVIPDIVDPDDAAHQHHDSNDYDYDADFPPLPNPHLSAFPSPPGVSSMETPLMPIAPIAVSGVPVISSFTPAFAPHRISSGHGWSNSALGFIKFAWGNRQRDWDRYAVALAEQARQYQHYNQHDEEDDEDENDSAYSAIEHVEAVDISSRPTIPAPPPFSSRSTHPQQTPTSTSTSISASPVSGSEPEEETSPLIFPRMGSLAALRQSDNSRKTLVNMDCTFRNFPLSQIKKILFLNDMSARMELQRERRQRLERDSKIGNGEGEGGGFVSIDLRTEEVEANLSGWTSNSSPSDPDSSNSTLVDSASQHLPKDDARISDSFPHPLPPPSSLEAKQFPEGISDSLDLELEHEHDWRLRWNAFSSLILASSTALEEHDLSAAIHPTSIDLPIVARQLSDPYVSYLFPESPDRRQARARRRFSEEGEEEETSFIDEHVNDPMRPMTPAPGLGRRPSFFFGRSAGIAGSEPSDDGDWDDGDDDDDDYGELVVDSRALFVRPAKVEIIEVSFGGEDEDEGEQGVCQ